MYKSGEKYWFDGQDLERIHKANHKFVQVTALEEVLLRNYQPIGPITSQAHTNQWTATELMNDMLSRDLLPRAASVTYLGKLLQKHGFTYRNPQNIKVYDIIRTQENSQFDQFLNK